MLLCQYIFDIDFEGAVKGILELQIIEYEVIDWKLIAMRIAPRI